MRLEAAVKHFSPKTTTISDSPRATASDALTGTDIMAALGFAESKAGFGMALFLGKNDVSDLDKVRAVRNLFQYALSQVGKYKAISRLENDVMTNVAQTLARYAYADYARSAASTKPCPDCTDGFIDAEVFTTKITTPRGPAPVWASNSRNARPSDWDHIRQVREQVRVLCPTCNGKAVVSNSCRCHGRGVVVDKEKSESVGMPIMKTCSKCQGRGYSRLPASEAWEALCVFIPDMPETTWRRNFKPLYEALITKCHAEESSADSIFNAVTR
ncbi:antitermination protein [Sodalis sp. RH22]|uniref:antitermination protein n=1 Tax=unclassified Sodalis (in: enterobacteria) TaxID=2636512 RepID=UPI0039B5F474